jgi:hypothetical protein
MDPSIHAGFGTGTFQPFVWAPKCVVSNLHCGWWLTGGQNDENLKAFLFKIKAGSYPLVLGFWAT